MRKRIVFVILISVLIMIMIGVIFDNEKVEDDNIQNINKFSITMTQNIDNGSFLYSNVYELDRNDGDIKNVVGIRHNAQYPLTYYDEFNKCVYYSSNSEDDRSGGDQLFVRSIKTKKNKQLTNELFGINYIIPTSDNKIFMLVAQNGAHTISPAYYDLVKKKYIDLTWDGDLFFCTARYNPSNSKMYASAYSNVKDYEMMDKHNMGEISGIYGIDNKIYEIDGNSHKVVYQTKQRYIDSFAIDGNMLICATSLRGNPNENDREVVLYDIMTKKEKKLENIEGEIFYLDSEKQLVYGHTGTQIVKYDMQSLEKEVLLEVDPAKEWINNVQ